MDTCAKSNLACATDALCKHSMCKRLLSAELTMSSFKLSFVSPLCGSNVVAMNVDSVEADFQLSLDLCLLGIDALALVELGLQRLQQQSPS